MFKKSNDGNIRQSIKPMKLNRFYTNPTEGFD